MQPPETKVKYKNESRINIKELFSSRSQNESRINQRLNGLSLCRSLVIC